MRILMVSPQPFFSPRGTPFSVLNRCRALSALGHEVDLITYHLGQDAEVPGLRIIRAPRIPGISAVKIGPSAAKLPLDASLFARTVVQLLKERYDVIHTHEEAGAFGWWLHRVTRTPHLYDMHSDLAQQLQNYGYGAGHPLTRFARWLENRIVRSAQSIIVICPDLEDRARASGARCQPVLIENMPMDRVPQESEIARWRAELAPRSERLVIYTGTLEPYQGVSMLLGAFGLVRRSIPELPVRLIVAGGRDDQIAELRQAAGALGVATDVSFLGVLGQRQVPALAAAADVLVSPRRSGTNTPLKVYGYLVSGRPIVATRIVSHTQVLDDSVAVLVDPTPEGLAAGLVTVLQDASLADRLAEAARRRAAERYTVRAFVMQTAVALAQLGVASTGVTLDEAARLMETA
jgi:glycosyltransferase involved in cell wall biosynthesis